jgi:carbon monoxide dehydrogenase subunit G
MALETSGEITVAVDRATAFAIVRDPVRLARCIPGCKDVRGAGPEYYTAVLTSRVGFMTLSFNVNVAVTKIEAPETLEATITGDAVGLSGHVVATARLNLTETADRQTVVRYATDVGLTGKLGSLGQPVLRATSTKMAREFGDNLKAEIERGLPPPPGLRPPGMESPA